MTSLKKPLAKAGGQFTTIHRARARQTANPHKRNRIPRDKMKTLIIKDRKHYLPMNKADRSKLKKMHSVYYDRSKMCWVDKKKTTK